MNANRFKWIIGAAVAALLFSSTAWADGKGGRGHGPKGKPAVSQHHGGHHKAPQVHGHHPGRFHPAPHFKPYQPHHRYHPHHKWRAPYRHHHRPHYYRSSTGGYLFSASIFEPGFVFGFATGSRW